jgi:hypothetical protein
MADNQDNPGIRVPPPLIYLLPLILGLVLDRRAHLATCNQATSLRDTQAPLRRRQHAQAVKCFAALHETAGTATSHFCPLGSDFS